MRLLVTGGRDYRDFQALAALLDTLHAQTPISLLIHGAARGADSLASAWAAYRNIPSHAYPANWDLHGKAAGPIRNQRMLTEGRPDAYLAFPGGRGTQDMVSRCKKANIPDAQAPLPPPSIFSP
jgi:hypothetical protein